MVNNVYIWQSKPCQHFGINKKISGLHCRDKRQLLPPANEVWGKVIFSVACVKNSVHRGGLPQCILGYHPPPGADTPLRADTSPDQAPPDHQAPPLDQAPPAADPPLDQAPPCAVHAGRYGQQTGGMHPTGMQSCWFRCGFALLNDKYYQKISSTLKYIGERHRQPCWLPRGQQVSHQRWI